MTAITLPRWQYRTTVLTLCMLAFFITMFARLAISPVVPLIREDFSVSNTQIGIALSGIWIAYAMMQFPSGVLADRYGEKPIILIAISGTGLASLLLALSPTFEVFVVVGILLGALAGFHYVVATTLLTRTYTDIGTAIGFHSFGSPLAGLIAPVSAAWIGIRFGWRPAVAFAFLITVPVALAFVYYVRPTEPRQPSEPMGRRFQLSTIAELLTRPPIAFTICIAITSAFIMQAMFSFLPTFLNEFHGYSTTAAGILFAGFFLVKAVSQVGVGAASDRHGRDSTIAVSLALVSVGLVLFAAGSGGVTIILAILCTGLGVSAAAAIQPRFLDELAEHERGSGFGLVRSIYGMIGATGSVFLGALADLFGWAIALTVLAALSATIVCALTLNWIFDAGY